MAKHRVQESIERHAAATSPCEARLERAAALVLRRQARTAAARFREHAHPLVAAGPQDGDPPPWVMPDVDEILPLWEARRELEWGLRPARETIVTTIMGGVAVDFGLSFTVRNPLAQGVLAQLGQHITQIAETTRQDVMRELDSSFQRGESIPQAAKGVQRALYGATKLRARTIARTELLATRNSASHAAAVMTGAAAYKTWASAEDSRVRPDHEEANGQTVPISDPFIVGGESLMYPGDPDASGEEVINCRCVCTYGDQAQTASADPNQEDDVATRTRTAAVAAPGDAETAADEGASGDASVEAGTPWEAVLCVEGVPTGDGRMLGEGGGTWRELPLTLMGMTSNPEGFDPGHGGADVVGRIDTITRDGNTIRATGVFDTGDAGVEMARLVGDGTVRGVSIDPLVDTVDYVLYSKETGEPVDLNDADEAEVEAAYWGESEQYEWVAVFVSYQILGATVCPMQALEDAQITLVSESDDEDAVGITAGAPARQQTPMQPLRLHGAVRLRVGLTASAVLPALDAPPREWFETPEADDYQPLTITDDGRVFGHIATWGTCHIGQPAGPGVCVEPERSQSDYAYFHLGELVTAEGDRLAVGTITLDTGHADLSYAAAKATRHYDDTGTAAAHVRASDGEHGIWVAGAVNPDLDARQLRTFRGSKPSGDWRPIGRTGLEMVGVLCVNVPGFPVPRARVAAATGQVMALIAGAVAPRPRRTLDQLAARALGRERVMDGLLERARG